MIESLDQVGMLFLSDLNRQEMYSRATNGSRKREKVFADNKHTTDTSHQMCRTRHRTAFQSTREKLNNCSHLTECADIPEDTSRTSQSARRTGSNKSRTSPRTRMDQTKDLHSSKCTRDTDSHCSECADTTLDLGRVYQAGRGRCEKTGSEHNTRWMTYE